MRCAITLSALVMLGGTTSTALAQATFTGLGVHPRTANTGYYPIASRDGSAVALSRFLAGKDRAARWTAIDGAVLCDSACDSLMSGDVGGISRNGRYIVGHVPLAGGGGPGFVWSAATGRVDIGDLPGGPLNAYAGGVSDDGQVVVGVGDYVDAAEFIAQAFRWTPSGFQGLGYLRPNYPFSAAFDVTADGSKIIGWSGRAGLEFRGFVWTQATGMQELATPADYRSWHSPWGMNSAGSFIVGNADKLDGRLVQIRWDDQGGLIELGNAPGGPADGAAIGVTDDGGTIVGFDHYFFDEVTQTESMMATIWTPTTGVRDLKQVLEAEYGLNLSGWTLGIASGISGDGTVIHGVGINPAGEPEYWRVELPGRCPADLNKDGVVDFADYLEFLNLFDMGC